MKNLEHKYLNKETIYYFIFNLMIPNIFAVIKYQKILVCIESTIIKNVILFLTK